MQRADPPNAFRPHSFAKPLAVGGASFVATLAFSHLVKWNWMRSLTCSTVVGMLATTAWWLSSSKKISKEDSSSNPSNTLSKVGESPDKAFETVKITEATVQPVAQPATPQLLSQQGSLEDTTVWGSPLEQAVKKLAQGIKKNTLSDKEIRKQIDEMEPLLTKEYFIPMHGGWSSLKRFFAFEKETNRYKHPYPALLLLLKYFKMGGLRKRIIFKLGIILKRLASLAHFLNATASLGKSGTGIAILL